MLASLDQFENTDVREHLQHAFQSRLASYLSKKASNEASAHNFTLKLKRGISNAIMSSNWFKPKNAADAKFKERHLMRTGWLRLERCCFF